MKMSKKTLKFFLVKRWQAVEAFQAKERALKLRNLTRKQAAKDYEDLCATWESQLGQKAASALDQRRLTQLSLRRRLFNRLASRRPTR